MEKLNEYLDAIQTLRDEKSQYLFLVNQLQDQEHILAQTCMFEWKTLMLSCTNIA